VTGVELVGKIRTASEGIDLRRFPSTLGMDGKKHYIIGMTLCITLGSDEGTLVCRLMLRGREIGSTTIDFSYR